MRSAILYGPLCGLMALGLSQAAFAQSQYFPTYQVGPQANGTYLMSTGQIVNPYGTTVILGSPVRAKGVALNPTNPNSAAVLNMGAAQAVEVIDPANGKIEQLYSPFGDATGSFTGITYTPDGSKLLFSQDDSHVAVASVDPSTGLLSDLAQIYVPPSQAYINCKGITVGLPTVPLNQACGQFYSGNTYTSNPGGIAITPDSKTAYVLLNGNNTLQAIDLTANPPVTKGTQIRVGNAPNAVVLNGNYAYVSNEGGRAATSKDFTNVSNGTPIVASTQSGQSITGTVSVVDLTKNAVVASINVGLHPTGMAISNGMLYVCDTSSEAISVVDLVTNKVVRNISLALPLPLKNSSFGAEPTNLVIVGSTAYVTLYTVNAIAVVDLSGASANPVLGYIPTASTPDGISYDATHNQLVVSNDKGVGTWGSLATLHGVTGYNTHHDTATANLIPIPSSSELATLTAQVKQNNHWDLTSNIFGASGGNPNTTPVAIPKRIGDPSLIKHVFYIVRENRTYDQVLGDVKKGNGDASLAVFGGVDTPNVHQLIKRFPLLDNYYNPSRQSADGHNWMMQAMAPYEDDIQSPDWIRSYPANSFDADAYQPNGFLWAQAEKAGLSVKIFGEDIEYTGYSFLTPTGSTQEPSWTDWYNDSQNFENHKEGTLYYETTISNPSEIPSLQYASVAHYPNFDLNIPDQWRVDFWAQNFQNDLKNGTVPTLSIIWIMCDHTGGPPNVNAEQADNDLAIGRVIDYISHSSVWPSSAIFISEDDAQDGVDHVDGHRSPGYVVSPYTKQFTPAFHTFYTQVNMTRTIEQILGVPPMNQFDLTATPMYNLFTNTPNDAPWTHVANQVPLNEGVNISAADMTPVQAAWHQFKLEMFKGKMHKADSVDPYTLNHFDWYDATGYKRPYPGEKTVRWPSDFASRIKTPGSDGDND